MSRAGLSWRVWLALCCCAFLALAPALAEARAGGSFGRPSSMGSRGSRTWEHNGAQPFSRSLRAPPSAAQPSIAPRSGYPAQGGGSFVQRHPFLSGLAGGVFGSWLFGHGAAARGTGGGAGSAIGALLWIVVIAALAWFALRLWRRGAASSGWRGGGVSLMPRRGAVAAMPSGRGR
ncbi:MAG: hypothetical protein ACREEZ_13785, partial [Stellaceae bacterium]